MVIIYIRIVELDSPMQHAKFQDRRFLVLKEKIFTMFYDIWAWRPSWSCDLDHLYKPSFSLSEDIPHTIRL